MTRRGLLYRFKLLSKPIGKPQWIQAVKATVLMVVSGVIASFLGFNSALQAIVLVTLLATIIIDISLPIKKVVILAVLGFFMTTLAFLSTSLAISSLPIFIFFTVLWAFFSISMYIFGNMEGSLGFSFFLTYFMAVLLVNTSTSTLDWISYISLSYAVASVLFIPKIWVERKKIRKLVTVGFLPKTTIQDFLYNLHILSGIKLNSNNYDIFKLGGYFKILRNYCWLVTTRMSSKPRKYFKNYLNQIDLYSLKLEDNFTNKKGPVDLKNLETELSRFLSLGTDDGHNNTAVLLSQALQNIIGKSNDLLKKETVDNNKIIKIEEKSFKEVIKANFNLKNLYIRHAIRFTIAMTIGLIFIYLTRERSAIWITMGILIILKPDITSTINNLIQRVGFNLLAIIVAIIMAFILPHYILLWLAVLMLFLFRAFYPNYMGFSVMAMTIFIVLVWPTGTVFDNAIARLFDIVTGGIIAFICAYVIFPSRVTVNLPEQLSKTIKSNIDYAKQILVISPGEFDKKTVQKCLNNYILQENNLDAGMKKLEDTFYDINTDLNLYQDIISANIKLAADLTALTALINENPNEIFKKKSEIMNLVNYFNRLNNSIHQGSVKVADIKLPDYNKQNDEFSQVFTWIILDMELIARGIEIAHDTKLFTRYTKLN